MDFKGGQATRSLLKDIMNKHSVTHRVLIAVLLSGVTLLSGCYSGLKMKREQELSCPTDIRQKVPWCAGEDAIFACPCGPDSEFYGMKPTCWSEWPASGADWRNAFCGSPAEIYPLSVGESVPGVPVPTPVAAPDEFYNPFGANRETKPTSKSATVPVPADKPQRVPGVEGTDSTPPVPEVTPGQQELPDKQGAMRRLPAVQPGSHTSAVSSKLRNPAARVQSPQQVAQTQLIIPAAPVADRSSGVVLAELRLRARSDGSQAVGGSVQGGPEESVARRTELSKEESSTSATTAIFEWPALPNRDSDKKPPLQIDVIPVSLPQAPAVEKSGGSVQIQLLDNTARRDKSPMFTK